MVPMVPMAPRGDAYCKVYKVALVAIVSGSQGVGPPMAPLNLGCLLSVFASEFADNLE